MQKNKIRDLSENWSAESEIWAFSTFFNAEQEYTNEKYEFAQFSLKFFKSMLTRIRKTRPQKDAATLPHKKKSEEKNRKNTTISNFARSIDAPSPLVGRIFESARNYATPPSFSPGAADRAQNEKKSRNYHFH